MSKNGNKKNIQKEPRSLLFKDDDTEYGLVTKKLGNGRFSVRLNMQNKEVIGRLCGKLRRGSSKHNNWVDVNTVVLVGIRDFQETIVDILYVYNDLEVRILKKRGDFVEESQNNKIENEDNNNDDDNIPFDFEEI